MEEDETVVLECERRATGGRCKRVELPIHKACTGAIPSHRKEESTSRRPSRRNLMLAGYLY
ncbi:hypothetical protein E2C01_037078 [Portunus trituberculatus]|uniref:Uncharacterized protein n=1 Tax=Portunus trituberculatus TaxID=210409 RepID=A0A5B7F769_PORTR|nr:hypothetical protein [Portunus trituberculatus]